MKRARPVNSAASSKRSRLLPTHLSGAAINSFQSIVVAEVSLPNRGTATNLFRRSGYAVHRHGHTIGQLKDDVHVMLDQQIYNRFSRFSGYLHYRAPPLVPNGSKHV